MKNIMKVTMTGLFEDLLVQALSNSSLHTRLKEQQVNNKKNKINLVMLEFMQEMAAKAQEYTPTTINDFRCFESGGTLIGSTYDQAFIAYPQNFSEQLIHIEGEDITFNMDGKSFGLIASMAVCRELSKKYEIKGDWQAVLDLLEAYFTTHDAVLSAGRSIDLLPIEAGSDELMQAYALDLALRTMLGVSDDGAGGTYDRLVKAKDCVSKPTLRMRISRIFRAS